MGKKSRYNKIAKKSKKNNSVTMKQLQSDLIKFKKDLVEVINTRLSTMQKSMQELALINDSITETLYDSQILIEEELLERIKIKRISLYIQQKLNQDYKMYKQDNTLISNLIISTLKQADILLNALDFSILKLMEMFPNKIDIIMEDINKGLAKSSTSEVSNIDPVIEESEVSNTDTKSDDEKIDPVIEESEVYTTDTKSDDEKTEPVIEEED